MLPSSGISSDRLGKSLAWLKINVGPGSAAHGPGRLKSPVAGHSSPTRLFSPTGGECECESTALTWRAIFTRGSWELP
jgi:hypothetical protein